MIRQLQAFFNMHDRVFMATCCLGFVGGVFLVCHACISIFLGAFPG